MSDEIRTAVDLRTSIVDQRGGIERFDGPQRRLLDALVFELAKKPNEIDVRVVTDLMAMLPRPVSVPESSRDDRDAAVAPLLKLFRHLHESVHTLSAENAQLRAALGGSQSPFDRQMTRQRDISSAITPPTCDIVPPSERAECDPGVKPGPDDWRAQRSPVTIEVKANPPPASPRNWDETDNGRKWRAWVDAGGGVGRDPWANNNR
jgi:hypothetical protein